MTRRILISLPLILLGVSLYSQAQLWSGILDPSRAINWTQVGVPGGIPQRSTICTTVQAATYGNGSSDATSGIQSALKNCPANQTVALSAGTFLIKSSISIPSNVTLRGAGANQTILNAKGSQNGVIILGSGSPNPSNASANITSGANAGSTSIVVSSASSISVGSYLLVTELNNSSYVTIAGGEGNCTWCDGFWNGTRARGQIVEVTSVNGTTIGITPLYSAFTNSPQVAPFTAGAKYAGVEDLQVYANNTGYTSNFYMTACAYCWIKGVEGNYTDGDHVQDHWGFRDEIRDSYFSNAYNHTPGSTDSDVFIVDKTSGTLVENNILERLHVSIMLNWGAAGNVIAYNYMTGNFDSGAGNAVFPSLSMHGAHPQFNLWEGNVGAQLYPDSVWGSSSHNTAYRNWIKGTTYVCNPLSGRGTIDCSSGHWTFQAARAMQISFLATSVNFVGNVVGSADMAALRLNGNGSPMPQTALLQWSANRSYDAVAYGWTFGYSELSDSGSMNGDSTKAYSTSFQHGNFNNVDGSLGWASGVTHTLPASFYRTSKPAWFGSTAWPPMGPDVSGGGGPSGYAYDIPAKVCFNNSTGTGGMLNFNADTCYAGGTPPPAPPTGLSATVS